MASQAALADRIRTELAQYLKKDMESVLPHHSLREDLGLDSMATIELLFKIEEAFDIQIPDQDLQTLPTVGDVIAYVQRRLRPAPSRRTAKSAAKRQHTKRRG
ncbi:MAG: acyl carrier protein [Nitrospiraceae bacterium]